MIGNHIGQLTITQMGEFPFSGLIGPPAGRQDNGAEFFTVGIKGQNVLLAFVVLHEFFMELLGRQLFAFVINLHLVRQGIGNVKLHFLTGFFKSNYKIPRLTGDPRDHGLGFDRDAGIIFQFFDFRV